MGYPWDNSGYNDLLKPYPQRPIRGTDIFEKQGDELTLIGHTLQWCNDMENACNEATTLAEEYYNLGVEHGYISPKKTTEDLLLEAMDAIRFLSNKIDKLETKDNKPMVVEKGDENDGVDGVSNKPVVRGKPTSGAKSEK